MALRAGESRPRAREALALAGDEQVLAAVLRRAVPAAFLEEVASVRPWSERPRVLARVVLNPRAPRSLSLRLVSALYWRDLADVAATLAVPAAVRSRAESLLADGLVEMRLGDRVTLARLATPALLPALLAATEGRVAESALLNPRLREEDVVTALRRERRHARPRRSGGALASLVIEHAVRLALVLQPRTPLPLALHQIGRSFPATCGAWRTRHRLRPARCPGGRPGRPRAAARNA